MTRILFILKHRDTAYACDDYANIRDDAPQSKSRQFLSSGLFNSARFIREKMHCVDGFETSIVHAIDNNCIDRLCTEFKPNVVIIEAFWVVPEKFEVLTKLHPEITWIVRNHSATPFLATEGIITEWSLRYMNYNKVILSCNDYRTHNEFKKLVRAYKPDWDEETLNGRVVYLPNFYPTDFTKRDLKPSSDFVDVGCFGAIRPLKNHLQQAIASIQYAEKAKKTLRFHINGTRLEGKGEPVLNNVRALFEHIPNHQLIEHPWMPHDKFVEVIRTMDICLQCSFTETFNIVIADAVVNDIPVVVSPEIKWVSPLFYADPTDSNDISETMRLAIRARKYFGFYRPSFTRMKWYVDMSAYIWKKELMKL